MKTSELTGPALDWAAAKAEDRLNRRIDVRPGTSAADISLYDGKLFIYNGGRDFIAWAPSTDWSQGGPVSEREHISSDWLGSEWSAKSWALLDGKVLQQTGYAYGPTELIAKMRCFVASKLGDEVDVPEELL